MTSVKRLDHPLAGTKNKPEYSSVMAGGFGDTTHQLYAFNLPVLAPDAVPYRDPKALQTGIICTNFSASWFGAKRSPPKRNTLLSVALSRHLIP